MNLQISRRKRDHSFVEDDFPMGLLSKGFLKNEIWRRMSLKGGGFELSLKLKCPFPFWK